MYFFEGRFPEDLLVLRLANDYGLLRPAKINTRIGHLAESESAAFEHAHAAAGASACGQRASQELLRLEVPEGWQ